MLYELLSQYNKKGVISMHMPGHKRNTAMLGKNLPYGIDITEIDGFDNLHDAHGVLKVTADIAARLYGSKKTFPLVNGSTGGIHAAVRSAVRYGDTVIMARNCHKSVYNAIELNGLQSAYLIPEIDGAFGICGSIRPEQAEKVIEAHPDAKLIILTSPTYEGVVSDIKAICDTAHRHKIPVLVDAAHGAHFGFSDFFPKSPVSCGADIVITSLHKTLPALTQCALAHVNGSLIDENRMAAELAVFQTSSPSYVLLSSIDYCLRLLESDKELLFGTYIKNLEAFDKSVSRLGKLRLLSHGADALKNHESFYDFDSGKIVISTRQTNLTGNHLAQLFRSKYRIELEMAYTDYALAMTSICDGWDSFAILIGALLDVDREAQYAPFDDNRVYAFELPPRLLAAAETAGIQGVPVSLNEAAGRMSLEYIWTYPPGVPFVVPGEVITGDMVSYIRQLSTSGVAIRSTKGSMPNTVYCAGVTSTYL